MSRSRVFAPIAVVLGAYGLWAVASLAPDQEHLVHRFLVVAASAVTAASCAAAAHRSETDRRGWLLFTAASVAWLAGNAVAGYQEIANGATLPVPSAADAPSCVAALFALLAVLSFLGRSLSPAARMRTLLDGLVLASALLFIAWASLLENVWRSAGEGEARILALAYPMVDLVLAALVLLTVTRVRPAIRLPWAALATGLSMMAIGHTAFAYLELIGARAPGGIDEFGWLGGCLLIGFAALSAPADAGEAVPATHVATRAEIFLPYVPLLLAGSVAVYQQMHQKMGPFLVVNGAVIVVLLGARQLLAQLENVDLARDLDARVRERTAELDRQERQFRSLVQNASDVMTVIDGSGVVRYQSASVERVLGFRFSELIGLPFEQLVHIDDRIDFMNRMMNAAPPPAQPLVLEARMHRKDGSWCVGETTVSNLLSDDGVRGILLTTRDVSERKILEEQLRHRAFHDPLTSLGNRTLFRDRVEHAVMRSARKPQPLAVMVIDLDGFKGVNDSLGHAAGDRLLKEVAIRLRASVRPGDTVARMGGDEFAILLEGTPEADAVTVAQRILNRLRAPIEIEGKEIVTQGSVGIAVGLTSEVNAEELQRSADLAMYVAKSKGKGRYAVFEPTMHKEAKAKVELESDLRRGLRERELVLHYQPIVELPTGRISGAEALVRWNHPERGMVPPIEFIPVAEESDLVVELGRYVLQEACQEAKRCQDRYPTDPAFTISVNVAARQLTSPWLVREVERALEDSGIHPSTLVLEITEGALMGDSSSIIPTLQALKDLGVQLAIDDFGTGWSSLSRLRSFPVDKVKIDRSFVSEIAAAREDAPIVAATIAMAHSLHLKVVAEGVETAEQLACLHHLECEEVQGYLLARPMPAEAIEELLLEPGGLLEEAGGAERGALTASERELMGVVAEAVQEPDGVGDLVRPVLAELHRVAGVDAVYLTEVLWEDLTQRVAYVVDVPGLRVPEGAIWPWPDSPCALMLAGQPKLRRDVVETFAGHPVCDRVGATAVVTVPVKTPEGKVFGTLCAASNTPGQLTESTVVLFELFARLLVEHVNRQAQAAEALV